MATEASAAEQATDGVEEKKVVDDVKIVKEGKASQRKETGESEGVEKPNVEEPASSEIVQTDSKESIEDKKDEEPAAEAGKKEDEVDKAPPSGVLEDEKDVAPTVDEVRKETEEAVASSSAVMGRKEDDTYVVEVVKEEVVTGKILNPDEPEIEAFEKEPEVKSTVTAGPVTEITKTTEEPLDTSDTGSELVKKESDVKEIGISPMPQDLDVVPGDPTEMNENKVVGSRDAFPENTEEDDGDIGAHGCTEETKNDESGQDASESLVKEVRVDTNVQTPSTAVGKSEKIETASVAEAAEILVKPEINVEEHKEEKTLATETVEECKKVKTADKEPVDEPKEEKPVAMESTLTAKEETVNLSRPATEVTEHFSEKDKPSEDGEKAVEEQREVGGSGSATEVTKTCLEEEKSSEVAEKVAEKLEDESVKDDTTVAQTSRDIDLEGTNKGDTSIKETADTSDVVEETNIASIEKDETEEKKDESHETEKTDPQNFAETSQGGAGSKTEVEVQRTEAAVKPKTLMSKVKHSIGKVKKAIIGKSPSSKTMSAESKDEVKIK